MEKRITTTAIVRAVARASGVSSSDIRGQRRTRDLVRLRWAAAWLARANGASYPQIGRALGGRDHTTIIHGVRRLGAMGGGEREIIDELLARAQDILAGADAGPPARPQPPAPPEPPAEPVTADPSHQARPEFQAAPPADIPRRLRMLRGGAAAARVTPCGYVQHDGAIVCWPE